MLQGEEEASPGCPRVVGGVAASSCVLARMRVVLLARRLRWTGAGDPHRITVAGPYPALSVPLQNSAKI